MNPASHPISDVVLEVNELRTHFLTEEGRALPAVDDVSFDVYPGETLGLVGESGSGKTTVARCILRAMRPTAGAVLFRPTGGAGVDLTTLDDCALKALRPQMQMNPRCPHCFAPCRDVHSSLRDVGGMKGFAACHLHDPAYAPASLPCMLGGG